MRQVPIGGTFSIQQADISKAARRLGYAPTHLLEQGMLETLAWD